MDKEITLKLEPWWHLEWEDHEPQLKHCTAAKYGPDLFVLEKGRLNQTHNIDSWDGWGKDPETIIQIAIDHHKDELHCDGHGWEKIRRKSCIVRLERLLEGFQKTG